jgi:hypothetical protein
MTRSRSHVWATLAAVVTMAAVTAYANPVLAAAIDCQFSAYGNTPLGVFVKAKTLIPIGTPIHIDYFVQNGGTVEPRATEARLTRDAEAQEWTLVTVDRAFAAALGNGTLAKARGCTASAPISNAPPGY